MHFFFYLQKQIFDPIIYMLDLQQVNNTAAVLMQKNKNKTLGLHLNNIIQRGVS